MAQQPGQHGQRLVGEILVDKGFLSGKSLGCAARGLFIFFPVLLRISGYNSATVGRRSFFFLLAEFFGCPRTNCPLEALLPRSNQYSARELKTHLSMARRAFRVSTQPITKSSLGLS